MSTPLKATAVQMATGPNVSANLFEVERIVSAAVGEGSNLIVLPENFAFMGQKCSDMLAFQERSGEGDLQRFLSGLARKHSVWLVGGTIPISTDDDSKVRAACLVYDDSGELAGRYDKMHLFDVQLLDVDEQYRESSVIEPGDAPLVVETPFGNVGVAVCYDLRFPELFRSMLSRKPDIFAIPSAFTAATGKAHWEPLVRARAIENLCYVIAAAQGGYHVSGRETHGHSMIVDPWGTVLAQVPRGSGFVTSKLDIELLHTTRRNFPSLDHRRLQCAI
ncbi:MAG: carbon-nitrogen hydrolase family protein [Pseudomonadota bacterium]